MQLDGTADQFGDEPLLIAQQAGVPVFVAAQRYDAGEMAEQDAIRNGALLHELRVHMLDDGFQHRQLHRDMDILLVNRADWRDQLLPAGNLREAMLRRQGACDCDSGRGARVRKGIERRGDGKGPIWRLRREMEVPAVEGLVAAFCGIARAGAVLFSGLEAAGLQASGKDCISQIITLTQGKTLSDW